MLQQKKPTRMSVLALITSLLAIIGVFAAQQNFNPAAAWSEQARIFIFQGITTAAFSVVAVVLYDFLHNESLREGILTRAAGAPTSLIESLFDSLSLYRGAYCSDYQVRITLRPPDEKELPFVICRIEYDYHKVLSPHQLTFQLLRVQTQKQEDEVRRANAAGYLNNELFYIVNERDLAHSVPPEILDKYYRIDNLHVDGIPTELIPLQGDALSCQGNPQVNKHKNKPSKIRYELEFPVELEGMVFATIELPTQGFYCRFDYTQVQQKITVSSQEFFSSQLLPSFPNVLEGGIHEHEYSGWLLPKSAIVFVWWPN